METTLSHVDNAMLPSCFRPLSLDVDPQKPPFGHHLSNSHRGMLHGLNLHAAHDKVSVYAVQ